jgi:2-succinyl-6-hydroxy-2,4-cyclohexadiene-1-carboxylate synthase
MPLHLERRGHGPRLALVHGFTQTRRCWGPEADALALDHELVAIDAPGHGRSGHSEADLVTGGGLLADAGGAATYLGYSMGARLALHVALARPEVVEGLVLVSGTAGIEDDDERAARRAQDARLAARLRADGLEAFLDDWLRQPMFANLPADRAFRAERLENTVDGLAASLEHAGTGSQAPAWGALRNLDAPVLVVVGADDAKFRRLGQRMVEEIGANARLAVLEGAGHAAHLEQPERFLAAVQPWLAEHGL